MNKKFFVIINFCIFTLSIFVISQEYTFEKFISSSVTVGNKVYPFYIVYENNQPKEIFIESVDWCDTKISGYGGPINLQIYFSLEGKVKKIKVIEQYETEDYAKEVFTEKFLSQYYGKNSNSKFLLGKDIKAVTGATISCTAVNEIVYQCVKNVNQYLFDKKVLQQRYYRIPHSEFVKTVLLLIISCGSVLAYFLNFKKIVRYTILVITILFLGIGYNGGFSIGHLQNFVKFNFPPINNIFFWSLFVIIILTTILCGRLYCGWLCPFGAVVEILFDIKKFLETMYRKTLGKEVEVFFVEDNTIVKFLRKYEQYFRYTKYLLVCAVFLLPALVVLEPFQYMFMFYKSKLWYVVYTVVILLLCIIFVRLWCRYLCPLGAVLALVSNFSLFKLKIDSKDCLKCEICLNVCPTNAIVKKNSELKLLHTECILCNKCLHACGPKCITRNFFSR